VNLANNSLMMMF